MIIFLFSIFMINFFSRCSIFFLILHYSILRYFINVNCTTDTTSWYEVLAEHKLKELGTVDISAAWQAARIITFFWHTLSLCPTVFQTIMLHCIKQDIPCFYGRTLDAVLKEMSIKLINDVSTYMYEAIKLYRTRVNRVVSASKWAPLTFWCRNYYFFLILAHPVYKMWIIHEPNTLELWNKLHFEEEKEESTYHV